MNGLCFQAGSANACAVICTTWVGVVHKHLYWQRWDGAVVLSVLCCGISQECIILCMHCTWAPDLPGCLS